MNCKPGDLAVVVACPCNADWIGHILRVVRPVVARDEGGAHWVCEPDIYRHPLTGNRIAWRDVDLRPLRNSDGTDESLTWAPKPETVEG